MLGLLFSDQHGLEELLKLQHAVDDPALLFMEVGEELLQSHQRRIDAGVSPDGTPFPPLSEAYKERKPRNKDKILILDGYLRDLLRYQIEHNCLYFGSDRPYARRLQYGDEGDKGMPARQWLGLSTEDIAKIQELVHGHLARR